MSSGKTINKQVIKIYLFKLLFYFSVFFSIFSAFWVLYQNSNQVDNVKKLSKPVSVSKMDRVYVMNDEMLLIHNYICGIFQCFDFNGNFVWGVHLPTTKDVDDTLVSFDKNTIFLWEGKTKTLYEYHDLILIHCEVMEEISGKKEFYERYPLEEQNYNCKFRWNGSLIISDVETNEKRQIVLQTTFTHYSFRQAIAGVFVGAVIFTIIKKRYLM